MVITGGTSGIGLATAGLLVDGGARVLVTGRTPASLESARAALGPGAIVVESDAVSGIDELVERVRSEFGAVDLLVLNAGGTGTASVAETDEALYDGLFDLNTKAPFFTLQKFLPMLGVGSAVVLTTSVSNTKGIATTGVYAATKAALRSMTRTFARELLERGVRVNAVSPVPSTPGSSNAPCRHRPRATSSNRSGTTTRCADSASLSRWRGPSCISASTLPTPQVPNSWSTVVRQICERPCAAVPQLTRSHHTAGAVSETQCPAVSFRDKITGYTQETRT